MFWGRGVEEYRCGARREMRRRWIGGRGGGLYRDLRGSVQSGWPPPPSEQPQVTPKVLASREGG